MEHNNGSIYAIYDNKAQEIAGQIKLHVFKHQAAALRFFGDVASDRQNLVGQHIDDFDLHCLGHISLDNNIVPTQPEDRLIITGKLWRESQLNADDIKAPEENTPLRVAR